MRVTFGIARAGPGRPPRSSAGNAEPVLRRGAARNRTVPPGPLNKSVPSSTFPCTEPHRCHLEGCWERKLPQVGFAASYADCFLLIYFFSSPLFFFSFSFLYELSCLRLRANVKASCYRGNWCGMAAWAGGTGWRAAGRGGGSRGSAPQLALCSCQSKMGGAARQEGSSPGGQGGPQAGPLFFLQCSEVGRAQQHQGEAGHRLRASCPPPCRSPVLIAVTRDFCSAEGVWEMSPAACPSPAYHSAGGSSINPGLWLHVGAWSRGKPPPHPEV